MLRRRHEQQQHQHQQRLDLPITASTPFTGSHFSQCCFQSVASTNGDNGDNGVNGINGDDGGTTATVANGATPATTATAATQRCFQGMIDPSPRQQVHDVNPRTAATAGTRQQPYCNNNGGHTNDGGHKSKELPITAFTPLAGSHFGQSDFRASVPQQLQP